FLTLNVDDSTDPVARPAVVHDSVAIGGVPYGLIDQLAPAPIRYKYLDTASAKLQTGTGGATVNVKATQKPLSVVGHANGTVVNVGNTGSVQQILGALTVTDPPAGAFVTLNVDDSADPLGRAFNIVKLNSTTGAIVGLAPQAIDFAIADLASLNVTAGVGS